MILSTCGASAVVFHTTSLCWRAAWARRTSHQGAVVARTAAVLPACRNMARRVSMMSLPNLSPSERQSLDYLYTQDRAQPTSPNWRGNCGAQHYTALEDQKHAHRR